MIGITQPRRVVSSFVGWNKAMLIPCPSHGGSFHLIGEIKFSMAWLDRSF